MKALRRSRRLTRAASYAALALGLAGGAVAVPGSAQARPLPTRSVAVSWGAGTYGNLGNGSLGVSTLYAGVTGLTGVNQVAAGDTHSLALTSGGSVWAWGQDNYGQLGDDDAGRLGYSDTPVPVAGLTGVRQIAAGGQFSLALRSDGTVWAWGRNGSGQLGNGTTNDSAVPVQVTGLSRVTQIAAGYASAMAALTRGFITTLTTVWTWGLNDFGQLGDGTYTSRSTPGQVSGIDVPNVRGISAGSEFSMVLGSDGSVWAWGADYLGQLGNGAADPAWIRPVETIGMDSGITQISAGLSHVLALRSDGTVLAWGDDRAGEIGNGTRSTTSLPMEVTGLAGVTQVAAGMYFSLAVHKIPFFASSALSPGGWPDGTMNNHG